MKKDVLKLGLQVGFFAGFMSSAVFWIRKGYVALKTPATQIDLLPSNIALEPPLNDVDLIWLFISEHPYQTIFAIIEYGLFSLFAGIIMMFVGYLIGGVIEQAFKL